ncbi:MAG: rRNA maturation RNase YbeY [candidate division KSB1 bacterium]|nr:rRNA maturation RNase YbeY [candidate division KSB1 bacterium]MDZ7402048.1 rRNA maturation RNase YbeY [candidate division KSB1 bacterium]
MSKYQLRIEKCCATPRITNSKLKQIAQSVLAGEGIERATINIVLVDDAYMIELNQKYLQHDEPTDVLSFNLSDDVSELLEGEIYADVDQIARQAQDYGVDFEEEVTRIIIHGILHLIGYDDRTDLERKNMTKKEDDYLTIYKQGR